MGGRHACGGLVKILATSLLFGAFAALAESIVFLIRLLRPNPPGTPPLHVELLRGVVLVVVTVSGLYLFGPRVNQWVFNYEVERGMDEAFMSFPSAAIIAKRHPDLYAQWRAEVMPAARSGNRQARREAAGVATAKMLGVLIMKYGNSIPDTEMVGIWRSWFLGVKGLAVTDSAAALEVLWGERTIQPDSARAAGMAFALWSAIGGAIEHPAPPPDSGEAEKARGVLIQRLRAKLGNDVRMLDNTNNPKLGSRAQVVALTFWDELLALPASEAGPYIRWNGPFSGFNGGRQSVLLQRGLFPRPVTVRE